VKTESFLSPWILVCYCLHIRSKSCNIHLHFRALAPADNLSSAVAVQGISMCTLESPQVTGIMGMFGNSAAAACTGKKQITKNKRERMSDPRQHKLKSDTPPCWTLLQQEQSSQQTQQQQQKYLQLCWLNIWTTGPEPWKAYWNTHWSLLKISSYNKFLIPEITLWPLETLKGFW